MNQRARQLRSNQTDTERRLWPHLRNRQLGGFKFKRQHPIGRYIADFVCLERRLVVEVDGGQHSEEQDSNRTRSLEQAGYRVIRFWDNEVLLSTDNVLEAILNELSRPSP